MLEYLKLQNVGPAPEIALALAPRLNILTGDNGLGKSFLLDIAWWALTRRWPAEINSRLSSGLKALPTLPGEASIEFSFVAKARTEQYRSTFDRQTQSWTGRAGRPANPGLILYAQVDGSFAVWDPARNYWRKRGNVDVQDRPPAYVFSAKEVWDGIEGDKAPLCNGLVRDWAGWQKESGPAFKQLKATLKALSPHQREQLVPGELTRISLDDVRDIPTLRMPYEQEVPILHASAGMRRIVALAYLLVWAWQEHLRASKLLAQEPTNQVIFLIDEIESHLHPQWQRSILQTLLGVMQTLTEDAQATVQVITATHSPLVLASVEPVFDPDQDAWFDIDLVNGAAGQTRRVAVEKKVWVRQGDAARWLTSDAFDLQSARSLDAEVLLEEAALALSEDDFDQDRARALDAKLRQVLGDTDPFWMRWRLVGEKKGWLP